MFPQPEYYVSRRRRNRNTPNANGAILFALSIMFMLVWFFPMIPVDWLCNLGLGAMFLSLVATVWK